MQIGILWEKKVLPIFRFSNEFWGSFLNFVDDITTIENSYFLQVAETSEDLKME